MRVRGIAVDISLKKIVRGGVHIIEDKLRKSGCS
jgi:hypothetical protein